MPETPGTDEYAYQTPDLTAPDTTGYQGIHGGPPSPRQDPGIHGRVKDIDRKTIGIAALMVILVVAGIVIGYTVLHANTPVRIGVLLDMTGDADFRTPLEWAKDTVNREGGINGRPVELVYRDTAHGNISRQAQDFLNDDSVRIVIGPQNSDDVYALAPLFCARKKVLISPTATSGDILRAFGKNGYVWRTTQGDAAQVKVILTILKQKGAGKIALLAVNNTYGQTFYDWTGFFATEYGINVTAIRQFDTGSPGLDAAVADALESDPDYLIAACWPEDVATIKQAVDRSGRHTRLFLTDAAAKPSLIRLLGTGAEGLEGTNPSADPGSGFTGAYQETFGRRPDDYAAPAYDALLIAAYTEARQERVLFEPLGESVRQVVIGEATVTGWNDTGVRTALHDIRSGEMPWITGASSGLEYDENLGVDPIATWYALWEVHNGTFRTLDVISSENTTVRDKTGRSAAGDSQGSAGFMSATPGSPGSSADDGGRTAFRAVILDPSHGWRNYRHESDALAIYSLLRENGVSDDDIILMVYDDIPTLPENPLRGDVHNIPKGENLRVRAHVDYAGENVSATTFLAVMSGRKTPSAPVVLESNATTDVFVYIASHAAPGTVAFEATGSVLTAKNFTALTDELHQGRRYRQMAFFVDTCFGESMATNMTAPGILYMTGANRNEPSLGATYDMDIRQWLSDEFTSGTIQSIRADRNITFRELYPATYKKVTGSHVRLITTPGFALDTRVLTFLSP